jgi:hypothetical protein
MKSVVSRVTIAPTSRRPVFRDRSSLRLWVIRGSFLSPPMIWGPDHTCPLHNRLERLVVIGIGVFADGGSTCMGISLSLDIEGHLPDGPATGTTTLGCGIAFFLAKKALMLCLCFSAIASFFCSSLSFSLPRVSLIHIAQLQTYCRFSANATFLASFSSLFNRAASSSSGVILLFFTGDSLRLDEPVAAVPSLLCLASTFGVICRQTHRSATHLFHIFRLDLLFGLCLCLIPL